MYVCVVSTPVRSNPSGGLLRTVLLVSGACRGGKMGYFEGYCQASQVGYFGRLSQKDKQKKSVPLGSNLKCRPAPPPEHCWYDALQLNKTTL